MVVAELVYFDQPVWDLELEFELQDLEWEFDLQGQDMLLFTTALITLIITLVVIYMVCGQSKLKALVANIALQHKKAVEAADSATRYYICEPNWYIVGLLMIIL